MIGQTDDREKLLSAKEILFRRGGADHAESLAEDYLKKALDSLEKIPDSPRKDLLRDWCAAMVRRDR